MSRNLFSLFWDITHWNRLCIRIATGGKPNQSTGFLFEIISKCNQNCCTFVCPPPRSPLLISIRFQCVMSQMKENQYVLKFIIYYFFSRGYILRVKIEWISSIVTFLHIVYSSWLDMTGPLSLCLIVGKEACVFSNERDSCHEQNHFSM